MANPSPKEIDPTNPVSSKPTPMSNPLKPSHPPPPAYYSFRWVVSCWMNERETHARPYSEGTQVVMKFILLGNGTLFSSTKRAESSFRPPVHPSRGWWTVGQGWVKNLGTTFWCSVSIIPFVWHVLVRTKRWAVSTLLILTKSRDEEFVDESSHKNLAMLACFSNVKPLRPRNVPAFGV